jgi:hypothetical protein
MKERGRGRKEDQKKKKDKFTPQTNIANGVTIKQIEQM